VPRGIDGLFALDRLLGDRGDLVAFDTDVAHCIESGFGVDDPPAGNNNVVFFVYCYFHFIVIL